MLPFIKKQREANFSEANKLTKELPEKSASGQGVGMWESLGKKEAQTKKGSPLEDTSGYIKRQGLINVRGNCCGTPRGIEPSFG